MAALALVATLCTACSGARQGPIRVAVMLPLTGPDAVDYRTPLEWARENVNAAGGVAGRPLELVYRDLGRQPAARVARAVVDDDSIAAAIGPANSEDARQVVTSFVNARKVVVTPSATSADLFRAFSTQRHRYFWRPVESDIAQARTLLDVAAGQGASSVALVTGSREYGDTFYNWVGFLATELGLRMTALVPFDQQSEPCDAPMSQALESRPDVVVAVPEIPEQAACMAKEWRARPTGTRLLFSDAAERPSLIDALGTDAEGLQGVAPAPDPSFAAAFAARFREPPTPYAANTYDALLLVAYGLQVTGGHGGSRLADAISSVVRGEGEAIGWDRPDVGHALAALRSGQRPSVNGAVGRWAFDKESGVELVASNYEHWQVESGRFHGVGLLSTDDSATARAGVSAVRAPPTPGRATATITGGYSPGPKTGAWALLVAASSGWEDYRHQADVLAQYQRLRANGVPDDHIVVVMADDLARNRRNPQPGQVPYTVGGPNLHQSVRVDYPVRGMTAGRLMAILRGESAAGSAAIRSGPGDDVYVFIAGHGNADGLYLGLDDCTPAATQQYSVLSPALLGETVTTMAAEHRYRRLLIAVEACEAGALGAEINAPGALLIAAASPVESSLSTNYDAHLGTWLADKFSYELWQQEGQARAISLDDLYKRLYLRVNGSHVSAYGPQFGDPSTVPLQEFLTG